MKRFGFLIAAGFVTVVNLFIFARVLYNRHGGSPVVIELTDRELMRTRDYFWGDEDSSASLEVRYLQLEQTDESREDLACEALAAIGRDCEPVEEYRTRPQPLPVEVWAALEFDGPARKKWEEEQLARLEERRNDSHMTQEYIEREEQRILHASRLVVVDVSADLGSLQEEYSDPSKYLFMRGTVRPRNYGQQWTGYLSDLQPRRIHVPKRWAGLLGEAVYRWQVPEDRTGEIYRVKLALGRLQEPWIESVEPGSR